MTSEKKEKALKERFLKIYANIPLGLREEIIAVLDDGKTLSWNAAFIEIDNDTDSSKIILNKMDRLGIL